MSRQLFDPLKIPLRGTHLIEASAGTGKTYAISTLVLRLLLESGLAIDRILVVTFTEAATAELRDRLRSRLRAALSAFRLPSDDPILNALVTRSADKERDRRRLEEALRGFDEAAIFTIHGFCHRTLHETAFESGVRFDTRLVEDDRPLVEEAIRDFWTAELHDVEPAFARHVHRTASLLQDLRSVARYALQDPEMPILPERVRLVAPPDPATLESGYARLRELWRESRERLPELLASFTGWRYSHKKPERVQEWIAALDAWFLDERYDGRRAPESLSQLTPRALDGATRVRHPTPRPDLPLFHQAQVMRDLEDAQQTAFDSRLVALKRRLALWIREELPRRKAAAGVQSFDDLLQQLSRALAGADGARLAAVVRSRFQAALIDEFQDTDPVQYDIFRRVYRKMSEPLFLIGDPKQAIYAFRGADVFTYLRAARDAAENLHTMSTNWRSDERLIEGLNALFGRLRVPFVIENIDYPPVKPRPDAGNELNVPGQDPAPIQIRFLHRPESSTRAIPIGEAKRLLPPRVAAEIADLLGSGATIADRPVGPGDIAVLTRTNAQAREMQEALRSASIPSVLYGDRSVFETSEATELQHLLRAVAEPANQTAVRTALATELLGVDGPTLSRLEQEEELWNQWLLRFRRWNELWTGRGFIRTFGALMQECDVQARLLAMPDGERRLTNVLHLAELLHAAATGSHLGPQGLQLHLAELRAAGDSYRPDAAQIRLESDDDAVKLVTIHKSKGLEYPIVYCPYLWAETKLHPGEKQVLRYHELENDRLQLDVDPDGEERQDRERIAVDESLAENVRLLYVALTRARHRCTVVWGAINGYQASALGYVLHPKAPVGTDDHLPDVNAPTGVEALAGHLKGMPDAQLLADLQRLEAASPGLISVAELGDLPGRSYSRPRPEDRPLRARVARHPVEGWWRTASFSQLVSGRTKLRPDPTGGRDRDESSQTGADPAWPRPENTTSPLPLGTFPRGARAGSFFHDVLEHLDFQEQDESVRRRLIRRKLVAYGYDANEWEETVASALEGILETPLTADEDALRLRALPRSRRLDEMEFVFPVADPSGSPPATTLGPADLATLFRAHPGDGIPASYGDALGRLGFPPLHGFLKGFVDLIFVHRDRWYVVDYKTNWLGPTADDYAPARLQEAMAHSHYYLQYHLYAVALKRTLQVRLPDFDYERHFGGVYYLFLRGMTPARGSTRGVFFERPPRARLEGLSALLAAPGVGRRER